LTVVRQVYEKNEVLERSIYCALRRKRRVLSQRMAFTKERVGCLAIIKVSIQEKELFAREKLIADFADLVSYCVVRIADFAEVVINPKF